MEGLRQVPPFAPRAGHLRQKLLNRARARHALSREGQADMKPPAPGGAPVVLVHAALQPPLGAQVTVRPGIAQQHRELIATDPGDDVAVAERGPEHAGGVPDGGSGGRSAGRIL